MYQRSIRLCRYLIQWLPDTVFGMEFVVYIYTVRENARLMRNSLCKNGKEQNIFHVVVATRQVLKDKKHRKSREQIIKISHIVMLIAQGISVCSERFQPAFFYYLLVKKQPSNALC